ncbi:hypothetical protein [Asticcacaulis benevestitus]|uniref:Uncharacterized protein n=1 Tax=Asticcacaulis benevestitus DSM 16100 = ATCC BAA-896 TaxID=1121022 RepID=V4P4B2_9CAUL|nr:hypothetical protein [Asticcacaulis benevestitus]ESQ81989.1 hypothetical protein ABENE_21320 [Asticcacaulis benevestitus DSM 16100 = ATCC BAA-896]
MSVTIKEVTEAFEFFYEALHSRDFRKTLPLNKMSERELLPLVRTYLLGYFWDVAPEVRSSLPGTLTGEGSIDFVVGDVAIELAVRRPKDSKRFLSDLHNATEIKKLMKHKGLAVLILLDFSAKPFSDADIERYRDWPSLGKGNHKKSPFNVAYFYREKRATKCIQKNIRV